MSNTEFTKGVWRVHEYGAAHFNNQKLGHVTVMYGDDDEHIVDTVYEIADAHLIAAAPEIYAMLERLKLECEMYNAEFGDPSSVEFEAAFTEVDELLAKARGES